MAFGWCYRDVFVETNLLAIGSAAAYTLLVEDIAIWKIAPEMSPRRIRNAQALVDMTSRASITSYMSTP